jgi:hypothetical protein
VFEKLEEDLRQELDDDLQEGLENGSDSFLVVVYIAGPVAGQMMKVVYCPPWLSFVLSSFKTVFQS